MARIALRADVIAGHLLKVPDEERCVVIPVALSAGFSAIFKRLSSCIRKWRCLSLICECSEDTDDRF